ncbi:MAG: transcription initiation factor IIB family protein [Candidatus Lokiarchaeota archaeon]|nr:transcription initiation factor IIB family protein [Candidatus Lokiarchaeota archaeon]
MKNYQEYLEDGCPECGGNIIDSSCEKVCKECGLVINKIFNDSSYSFKDQANKNHSCKQYVALGDRTDYIGGLGSYIGFESSRYLKDKYGKLLSPNEQRLYRRLKKNYSQFLRIKNHETEYRIFNILNKITHYLNLNKNIKNNAAYYYRKIIKSEEKVINNISLIAFCIFFAVRKENHNAPITIKEIAIIFQKFGHRVNSRLILRDGLKYKKYLMSNANPHKSEDYLNRLIHQVMAHNNLNERMSKKGINWTKEEFQNFLLKKAIEILEKLTSWKRGGRNPFILTGAIIYLADKLIAKEYKKKSILTQKMISEATNIAEYSIRDHYVNLLKPCFIE